MSACSRSTRGELPAGLRRPAGGAAVTGPFPVHAGPRLAAVVVAVDGDDAANWAACLASAGWTASGWAPAGRGGAHGDAGDAGGGPGPAVAGPGRRPPDGEGPGREERDGRGGRPALRRFGSVADACGAVTVHAVVVTDAAGSTAGLADLVDASIRSGKHVLGPMSMVSGPAVARRWAAAAARAGAVVLVHGARLGHASRGGPGTEGPVSGGPGQVGGGDPESEGPVSGGPGSDPGARGTGPGGAVPAGGAEAVAAAAVFLAAVTGRPGAPGRAGTGRHGPRAPAAAVPVDGLAGTAGGEDLAGRPVGGSPSR